MGYQDKSLFVVDCSTDCVFPCDFEQFDACVKYTMPEISCYGIPGYADNPSFPLSAAVYKIGSGSCEFIKKNFNDISGIPGVVGAIVPTYDAVSALISWSSKLSSDQIVSTAPLYCLGSNLSPSGYLLQNRAMNWGLQNTGNNQGSFYYNLDNIINTLPGDIQYLGSDIKLVGRSTGVVNTLHAQASSINGAFPVTMDMMPGHVEFTMNFNTPTGQIQLTNTVALAGMAQIGPFNAPMQVQDYGTYNGGRGIKQSQVDELLALKICGLDTYIQNLRYINITPCEGISYPDQQITTAVGVQHSWICKHEKRLNNIGGETVKGYFCVAECETESYDTTIQEWIKATTETICQILDVQKQHDDRLTEVEAKIAAILLKLG